MSLAEEQTWTPTQKMQYFRTWVHAYLTTSAPSFTPIRQVAQPKKLGICAPKCAQVHNSQLKMCYTNFKRNVFNLCVSQIQ